MDSPLFDESYYCQEKASQLNGTQYDGRTNWTGDDVRTVFNSSGISAYDHFSRYGVYEGLDPSPSFDVQKYLHEKADALNSASVEGKTTWTNLDVLNSIEGAGLDPVSHYQQYGVSEGISPFDDDTVNVHAYKFGSSGVSSDSNVDNFNYSKNIISDFTFGVDKIELTDQSGANVMNPSVVYYGGNYTVNGYVTYSSYAEREQDTYYGPDGARVHFPGDNLTTAVSPGWNNITGVIKNVGNLVLGDMNSSVEGNQTLQPGQATYFTITYNIDDLWHFNGTKTYGVLMVNNSASSFNKQDIVVEFTNPTDIWHFADTGVLATNGFFNM